MIFENLGILRQLLPSRSAYSGFGLLLLLLVLLGSSCNKGIQNVMFNTPSAYYKSGKPFVHINGDSTTIKNYEHRIVADDEVAIRFLNNLDITEGLTMNNTSGVTGVIFLVNRDGDIDLPMVGKLNVLGMTKQQTKEAIEKKYSYQYRDPKVEITIQNLSVSVQGEVKVPGIYKLQRERTSLIEVLSAAGGVTQYSKLQLVKVIRGAGTGKEPEILIFDLRQLPAIATEDMYLQDKDIVYAVPRDIKTIGNALSPYTSILSILSTVGTLAVVALNLRRF